MFVWFYGHTFIILLLYVDDIITTGNNPTSSQLLIRQLALAFAMKDLGPLHHFLGLEVHQSSEGLFLSQTKYDVDVLKKFKLDGAKPYSSPAVGGSELSLFDGDPLPYPFEYHSAMGALQYLIGQGFTLLLQLAKFAN